jgi:hypothetical protein
LAHVPFKTLPDVGVPPLGWVSSASDSGDALHHPPAVRDQFDGFGYRPHRGERCRDLRTLRRLHATDGARHIGGRRTIAAIDPDAPSRPRHEGIKGVDAGTITPYGAPGGRPFHLLQWQLRILLTGGIGKGDQLRLRGQHTCPSDPIVEQST